ncbi:MAG: methyl-accepting chemotaxis protein, partial [Bacteroidetes bacterium]|nr:methyl-accepting chemotaxis protein [Bacteroidota bacterium]
MKNISIAKRLWAMLGAAAFLLLIISIFGLLNLKMVNNNILSMYNDRVLPLQQLKVVSDIYAINIVDCAHKVRNGNISWQEAGILLDAAEKPISDNWQAYKNTYLTEDEKALADQVESLKGTVNDLFIRMRELIKKGQSPENELQLETMVKSELYQKIDPLTGKISELIELQLKESKILKEKSGALFRKTVILSILVGVLGLFITALIGISIIFSINKSLGVANKVVNEISSGVLNTRIHYSYKDEIGILLENVKIMQESLRDIITRINSGADILITASEEVNQSSQNLSQGASEQAS